MHTLKGIFAIVVLGTAALVAAAEQGPLQVSHFEYLRDLKFEQSVTLREQAATSDSAVTMRFDTMGRSFEVRLLANDRLLDVASRRMLPSGVQLYRGSIAGIDGSWVRIVVADGIPRGVLWDGTEMFALEAPGDSAVASGLPVIYRIADTYILAGTMSCGSADGYSTGTAAKAYESLVADLGAIVEEAAGATKQLNLGVIGDSMFVDDMNGAGIDPTTALLTRINVVDGIYSEQLGVQLAVQMDAVEVFDAANDPFSGTTVPGDLLDELSDYRAASPAQRAQGLTHLYTGRDLDNTTVGIAFRGSGPSSALCSATIGAGLSEANFGSFTDSLIAAHEIGHNFGAEHDGESGSVCESESGQFIMSPSITGTDEFSPCSITTMQTAIDAASCFVAVPGTDISIVATTPDLSVLLGNSATANFSVDNVGRDAAVGVSVDVTLPTLADIISSSASAGSCTSGAGSVNCELGTVGGGASVTVSVTTISSDVGSSAFDASVSAAVDDNGTNNQSSDAVNVTLSFAMDSGVTIDSATWDIGTCTVSGQQVDCLAATMTAQSDASLSVGVTGSIAGVHRYNVTVSSATDDRDELNNTASGSIAVSDPSSQSNSGGDDGGGGGGTGFPALLILLVGVGVRILRNSA
jgi:copper chaperone CopZ